MSSAIVCLAKFGDICNALPIARHFGIQDWIVNSNYASVLLGASYVKPVRVHFPPDDIDKAMEYAKANYSDVLLCQTFGKQWKGRRDLAFNEMAWLNCGLTSEQFHDTANFPLLFDRRDKEREDFLVRRHVKGKKPLLVLSVACAKSSPFASHHIFTQAIEKKWGNVFEIVNLCQVKAARIYDLLAILDRARVIVSSDSFVIHLAAACAAPVIALVNDQPFLASQPRRPALLRIPYAAVVARMREVHGAVASVLYAAKPEKQPGN